MDKNTIILYARKLKLAILILVAGILIFGVLINMLVPKIKECVDLNKNISKQTKSIEDNQKKLEELKASMKEKADKQEAPIKNFYKPIESGLDAESVMSEAFGDILKLIRANSIKTRAVKYDYNPTDDNFVKNASSKYNVCKLSLEMIADYKHFQAFLRDLYKHEHFLDISNIEIIPYEKDKKILLIKAELKLYSQKTESEQAETSKTTPAPATQSQESQGMPVESNPPSQSALPLQ